MLLIQLTGVKDVGKSLDGKRELGRGISQRADGRYHARAIVNGNRIELYSKDLKQLKKDFELAKANVLKEETVVDKNMTLAEFIDTWFRDYKSVRLKSEISRNTYYRRLKNTYVSTLGKKNVCDILHLDIQNTTNKLIEDGYTYRTVREALGALREAMNIAVVNRLILQNPIVNINIRKENEAMQERRVLENWEMPLFIEEAKRDWFYEMIMIMLSSGLRVGEASALCWEDINFKDKTININKSMSFGYVNGKKLEIVSSPKSQASYRSIPFFGETEELLKSQKQKQDALREKLGDRWRADPSLGNIVFCTSLGSPASRYALSHALDKIQKNMQLKENLSAEIEGRESRLIRHLHPHSLRHSFCTRCWEKQMNGSVIQALMGHSDFAVTSSYLHVLNDKRKEEADKIGNFFS